MKKFNYKQKPFEGYKYRYKVIVSNDKDNSYTDFDVYTEDSDSNNLVEKLEKRLEKMGKVHYQVEIEYWSTKEQDDLDTELINETLKDI
jgi:hypothetical protein